MLELEPPREGAPTVGARVRWRGDPLTVSEADDGTVERMLGSWPDADLRDRSFEPGADREPANVVVSVVGAVEALPVPAEARSMDLVHRRLQLEPRVQVAAVGDRLCLGCEQEATHNSRVILGERMLANHVVRRVPSIAVELAEPGLVCVLCDLHAWTRAWILVVRGRRRSAVSGADGELRLELPPGPDPLELTPWHERLGTHALRVPRSSSPSRHERPVHADGLRPC